jgi:hypothetical protein
MDTQALEFAFDVFYLVTIFSLSGAMLARLPRLPRDEQPFARRVAWAFTLLGTGDLGHLGLRVLAHLDPGRFSPWVGWGGLSTAITVTFFYVLMLEAVRVRTARDFGALEAGLVVVALVRLALLVPPANDWGAAVPPFGWSVARNIPLVVLGLAVTGLYLGAGRRPGERSLFLIGALMALSYACYAPVILLVQRFPLVGLLMIPKTVAYLAMGAVAWVAFFAAGHTPREPRLA